MSTGRAEDFEQKRRQIIDGALHVFASRGFLGATNRQIAAAAGIRSPGLLYHYFADKEDLFRSVLESKLSLLRLLDHPEEVRALAPREALGRIGRAYAGLAEDEEAAALLRLVLGEAVRQPAVAEMVGRFGPARILQSLAECLQEWMQRGLLRPADPAAAARAFLGPLVVFVLTRIVFRRPEALSETPESVVESAVDLFLRGLEP